MASGGHNMSGYIKSLSWKQVDISNVVIYSLLTHMFLAQKKKKREDYLL